MRFTSLRERIACASLDTISRTRALGSKSFSVLTFGLVVFLTSVLYSDALAQQLPEAATNSRAAALNALTEDTRYRVGPGDVLSIQVRKAPELSGSVRVD